MKIVIVGAGEVGMHIARQLVDDGKDVVLIERRADLVKLAASALDCIVIHGEGTHVDTLKEAGTANADVFIAATTSDEVNLVSCFIVASEFGVPIKVARVHSLEYSKNRSFTSKLSGVDYLVNTDQEAAWDIYQTVEQGAANTVMVFDNTDIQIRDYYVGLDSYFLGKAVKDLRISIDEDFLVTSVLRDGELIIPKGDLVIQEDDHIYIASLAGTFYKIAKKLGLSTDKIKKAMILGGSRIGVMVAEMLTRRCSVVLVDRDYEMCKEIAEEHPDIIVLHGEISDKGLFEEEGLGGMDVIISATQNEELNIVSGIYAKTLGVKRAIAVVEKPSYLTLAASVGVDSTVSAKYCAVNSILKLVRKGNIASVHSLFDGRAEAIDARLTEKSKLINTPLKDIQLPPDTLIVAINRNRRSIIADGNLVLLPGDRAIIFAVRASIVEIEGML